MSDNPQYEYTDWEPTPELRYRREFSSLGAWSNASWREVLQQRWKRYQVLRQHGALTGVVEYEWRDIPVVE